MKHSLSKEYAELLVRVKERVRAAQLEALRSVNRELIGLYWDIGRMVVEKQKGPTWGKAVVENLARDLQKEFPGVGGFSAPNLWRAKVFYETYRGSEKLAPLVREIAWSHNVAIFEKCKDALEREFYLRSARKFGWTKNILIHQIENQTYKKTLLNQTNFAKTVPAAAQRQAKLAVKDEYTFDFLELGDDYSERQLETALLGKVDRFLMEMGGLFAFVGRQYRLEADDKEYFIDLLLYHRKLRCLVAVELKIGEFLPEYVGKMQFYLAVLDDKVRLKEEAPSIGIILCKSKNKTIVEYALKQAHKPIGVAAYRVVTTLPRELKGQLPAPNEIAKLLEEVK